MTTEAKTFLSLMSPDIIPTIKGIAQPYRLFRYDKGVERYYFRFEKGQPSIGYLSVTEFCKKSLGTSAQLAEWKGNVGNDYASSFSRMRAEQGTNMHEIFTQVLKDGKGNFQLIAEETRERAISLGFAYAATDWADHIIKAVAAFLTFVKEKEVEPISAEFTVCSDKYGLAGSIDLPCTLMFNKKRVTAIVDYKLGGFYESHELQLHAYKELWNEWYGNIKPVTHVFNFSPNEWKGSKPTYKFKNQTKSIFADSIKHRLQTAKIEGWVDPPTTHFDIVGDFEIESFDIENHVTKTAI